MATSTPDAMVSPRVAAQALGISRERCMRLVERGILAGDFDGRYWWISRASLRQFLQTEAAAALARAARVGDPVNAG